MATAKKKTTRKRKTEEEKNQEEWTQLVEAHSLDNLANYTMAGDFPLHSAVKHPKFGDGIVKVYYPSKVEVFFQTGPKVLVQNRK